MDDLAAKKPPMESVRALLTGAIDYAGLFPPSQLSMEEAVVNYAKYRGSEHSWMLGRFVVPVARLDELRETASQFVESEGSSWPISALAAEDVYDTVKRLAAFNSQNSGGFAVDSLEVKANSVSKI